MASSMEHSFLLKAIHLENNAKPLNPKPQILNPEITRKTRSQVLRLHAFVTAFRGDWKALYQVFCFNRYADRDEVGDCSICAG